jgi:hypothetical protein
MKATINGTMLNEDRFVIELDAEQMEDLAVYYLLESCKWDAKNIKYDGNDMRQRDTYNRLADKYYTMYKSIKAIQGKEEPIGVEYILEN